MSRGIRSEICGKRAYVRFLNKTSSDIELIWIDFSGRLQLNRVIGKDQFLDVNTFVKHPWMAVDHNSKSKRYIEGELFFYPPAGIVYFKKRYPEADIPDDFETRTMAYITVPVFSLKYLTLQVVRKRLNEESDAEELDIPKNLIQDIQKEFNLPEYKISEEN